MSPQSRVRLARRHAGWSQMQLALAVGVQRSAVSHWESVQAKNPNVTHLREIALVTGVQFEWLVTGRGVMTLCNEVRMDSVPTAAALLVEEPIELRLLHAFRDAPPQSRVSLVEIVEQLAAQRTGRSRDNTARRPPMQHEPQAGTPPPHRVGETVIEYASGGMTLPDDPDSLPVLSFGPWANGRWPADSPA